MAVDTRQLRRSRRHAGHVCPRSLRRRCPRGSRPARGPAERVRAHRIGWARARPTARRRTGRDPAPGPRCPPHRPRRRRRVPCHRAGSPLVARGRPRRRWDPRPGGSRPPPRRRVAQRLRCVCPSGLGGTRSASRPIHARHRADCAGQAPVGTVLERPHNRCRSVPGSQDEQVTRRSRTPRAVAGHRGRRASRRNSRATSGR